MSDDPQHRTPAPGIVPQQTEVAGGYILHDQAGCPSPTDDYFDPDYWRARGAVISEPEGRAPVCIFSDDGHQRVLRHYHRGGWVAHVSRDRYWWNGLEQTRAWREWHLLMELYELGLPVPRPVAARVLRHGLTYSADLVTDYLAGTRSLADVLLQEALDAAVWQRIGAVIKAFHVHGVYHADLNARNILLDGHGGVFLIDFDKGVRKNSDPEAQLENLERLQRSLNKFSSAHEKAFRFGVDDWRALLAGYRDAD